MTASRPATDSTHNLSLEQMDRQSVIHPMTNLKQHAAGDTPFRLVQGGQGCFIHDSEGNRLLDAFAGLYCVNIGYGRTEVAEAIAEQAHRMAYYHHYAGHSSEPTIRLTDKVLRWMPESMSKVYYGLSGSDANETNVKLVWYVNNVLGRLQKKKIISRQRGYHGSTIVSGSLTGLPMFHDSFDLPVEGIRHTTTPHHYWQAEAGESETVFAARCAAELDALIEAEGPETVAAFIAEPVMGTGGIIVPPEGYWPAIQAVLKKHDVLMIADEVVCGFGRLGSPTGCHHYGIEADLITIAKGLTSAYQPLSGAVVGDRVWEILQQGSDKYGPFAHGYTYSAHPVGAAAGVANLEVIERDGLMENARDTGAYFQDRMRAAFADHPLVGEVRGVGLLAAVEFVADRTAKTRFDPSLKIGARLAGACVAEGVVARAMPHGDILGYAPPLCITRAEVDAVVEKSVAAVAKVTDALTREGLTRAA